MQTFSVSGDLVAERLARLRQAMQEAAVDACIVPAADPHLSEYLPAHWKGREWLSGFDGSAGTLVVTANVAGLWTDSRYWEQAEKQLEKTDISLMKMLGGRALAYADWLTGELVAGMTVAVDGQVIDLAAARQMEERFCAASLVLRTDCDLLSAIWQNRPALPLSPVFEHDAAYVALSRSEKLLLVRQEMQTLGAGWHVISTLDDIAWLLNLRGADIDFNPLFIAHFLLGREAAHLFVAAGKIPAALLQRLEADGITLHPYEKAAPFLAALPKEGVVLVDPRRVTVGMYEALGSGRQVVESINPTVLLKSRKAEAEIAHIRRTMEEDGAALCEFFAWFEIAQARGERLTELTVAEKLEMCRKARPGYVSLSFATIAGFNENGALPHYRATEEHHAAIGGQGLLLIDSGGQYTGGTTDITRVVPVGEPIAEQKRDFTLVLKGLITLSGTHFPCGIRASMLDAIARAPLWLEGVDYGHGTGHGIGYFLNVHEGPQSISCYAVADAYTAMEEGMVTSIEPGIYRPGQWGIRLENLVVNRKAETSTFGEFLCFETLTLCPIDTRCIELSLLTHAELAWLNRYHAQVRRSLLPYLSEAGKAWLVSRTQAL